MPSCLCFFLSALAWRSFFDWPTRALLQSVPSLAKLCASGMCEAGASSLAATAEAQRVLEATDVSLRALLQVCVCVFVLVFSACVSIYLCGPVCVCQGFATVSTALEETQRAFTQAARGACKTRGKQMTLVRGSPLLSRSILHTLHTSASKLHRGRYPVC